MALFWQTRSQQRKDSHLTRVRHLRQVRHSRRNGGMSAGAPTVCDRQRACSMRGSGPGGGTWGTLMHW